MKLAWLIFDVGGMGELDAGEFRQALPLFGEDVSEEKVFPSQIREAWLRHLLRHSYCNSLV